MADTLTVTTWCEVLPEQVPELVTQLMATLPSQASITISGTADEED